MGADWRADGVRSRLVAANVDPLAPLSVREAMNTSEIFEFADNHFARSPRRPEYGQELGVSVSGLDTEFREFVAGRSRSLLRTAYLLTGDHHHAEDLLQTALTKVYLSWSSIRVDTAVEAYVRTVLVHTYISWWRRRSWSETATELADVKHAPDPIVLLVDRNDMWQRLQALSRQQRAVIVLRFYDDLSVDETARALQMSAGTVKSHTHRALAALRIQLTDEAATDAALTQAPTREHQ